MVTVTVPAGAGNETVIVTFTPLKVPLGAIPSPMHRDTSFDGHTSVSAAPVSIVPVCVKSVYIFVVACPFAEVNTRLYCPVMLAF